MYTASSYKTSLLTITYFGVTPKSVVVSKPNIHKQKGRLISTREKNEKSKQPFLKNQKSRYSKNYHWVTLMCAISIPNFVKIQEVDLNFLLILPSIHHVAEHES